VESYWLQTWYRLFMPEPVIAEIPREMLVDRRNSCTESASGNHTGTIF